MKKFQIIKGTIVMVEKSGSPESISHALNQTRIFTEKDRIPNPPCIPTQIPLNFNTPEPYAYTEVVCFKTGVPEYPILGAKKSDILPLTGKEEIALEALTITEPQKGAILQALQFLAGICDFACHLDNQGFNKKDADLGHKLAELPSLSPKQAALGRKIARKYHRQIPPDLFSAMNS